MTVEPPCNSCPEPPADSSSVEAAAGSVFRVDDGDAHDPLNAVIAAVDYRGDVTITRKSSPEQVVGYVYDYRLSDDPMKAVVRLLPADGGDRLTIPLDDLIAIEFSGKDAAEGRSFETWAKEYASKRLAAESPETP